ncbi:MAG: transglutaminase domain-containing protein, partial [Oscillospiraceae bacterium]|nr:transglutaminase domain-containing protein [Oscillospiraceae bacterium]
LEPGTDMAVALDINEYVFYSSAAHAWAKARDSGIPADELNEFFSGGRIMTDYISRAARRAAYENGTADASDLRIDSGDYADLMVSLLRAAGIPARTVCGLNLSTAMTPYSYTRAPLPHAWVEFYSGGWRGTDPYYGNAYMDNAYGNLLSYGTADRDVNSEARRETAAQMAGDGYALVANSGAPHNYMAFSQDAGAVVTLETDYKYR